MPKLDSDIYGSDDTGMAGRISSDALGSPDTSSPIDQSARSKGNNPSIENEDVVIVSNKSDSRAKTKGNH